VSDAGLHEGGGRPLPAKQEGAVLADYDDVLQQGGEEAVYREMLLTYKRISRKKNPKARSRAIH
jgi:hypothetical protein